MNQPYMPQNPGPSSPQGSLPPELAQILSQYDQIVSSFEQGYMSAEQAQSVLNALVVIDLSGALWSLNTHRQFTRRETPDAQPQLADPVQFASAAPAPAAVPAASPVAVPPMSPGSSATGGSMPNPSFPTGMVPGSEPAPVKTRQKNAALGALGGWARKNKPTVIVAGVAIVVLAVVFVMRGGSPTPGDEVPAPAPTTSAAPGSTQALPTLPTNDRVLAVLTALGSGDQTSTKASLAKPGTAGELAVNAAQWVGFARLGLVTKTDGPPTRQGDKVTQTGSVSSPDGTKLATFSMEWQRESNGTWILTGWPQVTPTK